MNNFRKYKYPMVSVSEPIVYPNTDNSDSENRVHVNL